MAAGRAAIRLPLELPLGSTFEMLPPEQFLSDLSPQDLPDPQRCWCWAWLAARRLEHETCSSAGLHLSWEMGQEQEPQGWTAIQKTFGWSKWRDRRTGGWTSRWTRWTSICDPSSCLISRGRSFNPYDLTKKKSVFTKVWNTEEAMRSNESFYLHDIMLGLKIHNQIFKKQEDLCFARVGTASVLHIWFHISCEQAQVCFSINILQWTKAHWVSGLPAPLLCWEHWVKPSLPGNSPLLCCSLTVDLWGSP